MCVTSRLSEAAKTGLGRAWISLNQALCARGHVPYPPLPADGGHQLRAALDRRLGLVEPVLQQRNVGEEDRALDVEERKSASSGAERSVEQGPSERLLASGEGAIGQPHLHGRRAASVAKLGEDAEARRRGPVRRPQSHVLDARQGCGASAPAVVVGSRPRPRGGLRRGVRLLPERAAPEFSYAHASSRPRSTSRSVAQSRAARRSSGSACPAGQTNGSSASSRGIGSGLVRAAIAWARHPKLDF